MPEKYIVQYIPTYFEALGFPSETDVSSLSFNEVKTQFRRQAAPQAHTDRTGKSETDVARKEDSELRPKIVIHAYRALEKLYQSHDALRSYLAQIETSRSRQEFGADREYYSLWDALFSAGLETQEETRREMRHLGELINQKNQEITTLVQGDTDTVLPYGGAMVLRRTDIATVNPEDEKWLEDKTFPTTEQFVALVKKKGGVEKWNKWREKNSDNEGRLCLPPGVARYMNLTGIRLGGLDLTGSDFSHAVLNNASFNGWHTMLDNCNFSAAHLRDADLSNVHSATGTNFKGADLTNSHLDDSNFEGAVADRGTCLKNCAIYEASLSRSMVEAYALSNGISKTALVDFTGDKGPEKNGPKR